MKQKLEDAKELFDQGIISEAEFQEIKAAYISELQNKTGNISANKSSHETAIVTDNQVDKSVSVNTDSNDGPASIGIKILCLLLPIVGLIIFLIDRVNKPVKAHDELIFTLIGWAVSIVLAFIV